MREARSEYLQFEATTLQNTIEKGVRTVVTDELSMKVATFRFGVIADFVTGVRLERGDKMRLLKEKAERRWDIPGSDRSHVSISTMLMWIRKYEEAGSRLEGLMPKARIDRGTYRKLDPSLRMAIKGLKQENPRYTVPVIIRKLKHGKIIAPEDRLNTASIYRFIRKEGLATPSATQTDRRRFEASYPNEIWQCDIMHGPKVKTSDGPQRKSYLCLILDDHSRLIIHAAFHLSEGFEPLKDSLKQAVMKRGIPQKFYVDNGSCYRATNLEQILAQLGTVLTHSRPYTPQGRGKVERLFRYVRQDFIPMHAHKPMALDELNELLDDWVDEYNDKPHSSIGSTPYERFRSDLACVRPAPDRLDDYFRVVEFRKVRKDRSIQINKRLFEVAVGLIDKKIEARFHKESPEDVEIFFDGRSHGKAVRLDPHVNARVGRDWGDNQMRPIAPSAKDARKEPRDPITGGQLFPVKGDDHERQL